MSKQVSDLLAEVDKALGFHLGRPRLGNATKEKIGKAVGFNEKLRRFIQEIEEHTLLDLPEEEHGRPEIDFASLDFEETISHSTLLNSLHRAGIDIKGFERFNPVYSEVAQSLAAVFREVSDQLKAFRKSRKGKEDGEFTFLTHGGQDFAKFLGFLDKSGAVEIERVLLQNKDQKKWVFFKPEYYATSTDNQSLLVIFKVLDTKKRQFLMGDWMTAFTYTVIQDHLTRNEIHHEIFAKVRYSAPVDVINSSSDFDVIVLVGNEALCFECKSGNLDAEHVVKIAEKAVEIDRVLKNFVPNINSFRFFTVFDETINIEENVRELFHGTPVAPKRIDEIRALVMEMFNPASQVA